MISPKFNLTGEEAKGLLYGLLEVDKNQLRANPNYPSMRELIQAGKVKYEVQDPDEEWQSYRELVEKVQRDGVAYADCEDLATAVAAEDQVRMGIMSEPLAYSPRQALFHVVVKTPMSSRYAGTPFPPALRAPPQPGFSMEDPSRAAGMQVSFNGMGEPVIGKPIAGSRFGGMSTDTKMRSEDGDLSSYTDSLLGLSRRRSRPLGAGLYRGILPHFVQESPDLLGEPITDEEADAMGDAVAFENFGSEVRRSRRHVVFGGSISSSDRPLISFGSMPLLGRDSTDSEVDPDLDDVEALAAGYEDDEDPTEAGLFEFIEERL